MYSEVLVTPDRRVRIEGKARGRLRSAEVVSRPSAEPHPTPNIDIRGYPFLFRQGGARLIIAPSGRILWLSAGGRDLAGISECIDLADGVLAGRTRHSEMLLKQLIADAEKSRAPVDQLVARAANDVPELFLRARSCSGRASSAIALTIRQLGRKVDDIPDLIRLYGLTPTEQQVTKMMLQGLSVTAIAEELHKSVLTVRTHIKRTYMKVNVGSKEQLFSAVIRLMVD